jgi:hypothetical protein
VLPGRRPTRTEYACLSTGLDLHLLHDVLHSRCKHKGFYNGLALTAAARLRVSSPARVVPHALHITSSVSYRERCQRQTGAHRQASRSPLESDMQSVNVLAKLAQGSLGVCATCAAASCTQPGSLCQARTKIIMSELCALVHTAQRSSSLLVLCGEPGVRPKSRPCCIGRQALSVCRALRLPTSF